MIRGGPPVPGQLPFAGQALLASLPVDGTQAASLDGSAAGRALAPSDKPGVAVGDRRRSETTPPATKPATQAKYASLRCFVIATPFSGSVFALRPIVRQSLLRESNSRSFATK